MAITLALAGNPNCGKTTLFNALTGSNQYVGNWPGVTVEKKEGKLKGHPDVVIQDLPGIYSLSPYTLEEVVSRNYLVREKPDAILDVVDGTNIERNLYLTTQLLEIGLPVVVAINMADLVEKHGDIIDTKKLSDELGCPVVVISALKNRGGMDAVGKAVKAAKEHTAAVLPAFYDKTVEEALQGIEGILREKVPAAFLRWYAVKVFERDEPVLKDLALSPQQQDAVENLTAACEKAHDDDAESLITNQRYNYISSVVKKAVHKKQTKDNLTVSDKIDRVVTNRILALPIFMLIMFGIYFLAMNDGSIGKTVTDWLKEDVIIGFVGGHVNSWMVSAGCADWLTGLVVGGIISGVGSVLGFVPQMIVLFLMLAILEDIGYMARVAFIMDRIFRKFGLSGKSFIPMLIATGCGVPALMASRTIEQDRDRKITLMTTTFIPCSAKIPIIGLIAGAVFGGSAFVAVSAYFIGIAAVVISGIILKKFKPFAGEPAPFVMELPAYHVPSVGNVLRATWERAWSFIKRAGTIILLSSIILWFLQAFGVVDGSLQMVEDNNGSLLAAIGNAVAIIFAPLGWVGTWAWKATVATVTGLIAKEEVVSTFGVLYNFSGELSGTGEEIWAQVGQDFGPITAYSFMLFNLLCAPCFAAMGAIKREMNNAKWTLAALGYMTVFAYSISMIVYQLGGLFTGEATFGVGTIVAIILLGVIIYLLVRPTPKYSEKEMELRMAHR